MPGKIFIPEQVSDAIRKHVIEAVQRAESGYTSAQEEEDTITGELFGTLRTSRPQVVDVSGSEGAGPWRWSIGYSKFRSKARDATESVVGADGILEIRVGSPQRDQQKSALFQAKNASRRDLKLVEQCVKMSVWREAAFVINYTNSGYSAFSIDDVLSTCGDIAQLHSGSRLAKWLLDSFIACRVGHPDLFYDKSERRLYWARELSNHESSNDEWVWVNFKPKHLLNIQVDPPHYQHSRAKEIVKAKIRHNRLTFTPEDLYGISGQYTLSWLKRRRAELLRAYHSDRNHHLTKELKTVLGARIGEINNAFDILVKNAREEEHAVTARNRVQDDSRSLHKQQEPGVVLRKGKVDRREKVYVHRRTRT